MSKRKAVWLQWPVWFEHKLYEEIKDPHCTALYLGKFDVSVAWYVKQRLRSLLDARPDLMTPPPYVSMLIPDVFGPETERVEVLRLVSQNLIAGQGKIVDFLAEEGFKSGSEFPFNPHVTIGPYTGDNSFDEWMPRDITFGHLEVK